MEIDIKFDTEWLSNEELMKAIMEQVGAAVSESMDKLVDEEETTKADEKKKLCVYTHMSKIKDTLEDAIVDIEAWMSDAQAARDYNDFYGKYKTLRQALDSQMRYVIKKLNV